MGYQRNTAPRLLTGDELTAAMVGIGMLFDAKPSVNPDIEDTVLSASVEGLDRDQLRVLSVLTTWLGVHCARLNADRLVRGVEHVESRRVRAYWAGVGEWLHKDRRLARLGELYSGERLALLDFGMKFFLARDGEDLRFAGGPLVVPGKALRDRAADVASPASLAQCHRTYRWRLIMGSSYRADVWALLEEHPELTAAELARRTRASIATAWQTKRDRALLAAA